MESHLGSIFNYNLRNLPCHVLLPRGYLPCLIQSQLTNVSRKTRQLPKRPHGSVSRKGTPKCCSETSKWLNFGDTNMAPIYDFHLFPICSWQNWLVKPSLRPLTAWCTRSRTPPFSTNRWRSASCNSCQATYSNCASDGGSLLLWDSGLNDDFPRKRDT